jgi:trimethylamine--corrinoid protein Co-methyltransferase
LRRDKFAGYTTGGGFRLQPFTKEELDHIHRATLEVLEYQGVFVQHDEAMDYFAKGGAKIDTKTKIVRIPPFMVKEALMSCPETVVMHARDPKQDAVLEANRVAFTNFGEALNIYDIDTGEHRETLKRDMCDIARICDWVNVISVVEQPAGSHDMPQEIGHLHDYEALMNNTSKHVVMMPHGAEIAELLVRMSELAAKAHFPDDPVEDHRILSFLICPVSPLRLLEPTCDIIIVAARNRCVCNVLSMAMSGGSSSIHLAGTLVTHNAEVLSGIVLSQLVNRGAPIIYGSSTTAFDLRTGCAAVGSPELGMIGAAVGAMAQYYNLPSWTAGG